MDLSDLAQAASLGAAELIVEATVKAIAASTRPSFEVLREDAKRSVLAELGLTPQQMEKAALASQAATTDAYARGSAALSNGDYVTAIMALQQARSQASASADGKRRLPEVDFRLATALARSGDHRLAIPYLQEAVAIQPRDVRFLNGLGEAYFLGGDVRSAEAAWERARAADRERSPKDFASIVVRFNLAGIAQSRERPQAIARLMAEVSDIAKTLPEGPAIGDLLAVLENVAKLGAKANETTDLDKDAAEAARLLESSGPDSPNSVTRLLAAVLRRLGSGASDEELRKATLGSFGESIQDVIAAYGPNSNLLPALYLTKGGFEVLFGDVESGLQSFLLGRGVVASELGETHPATAPFSVLIGEAHWALGHFAVAEEIITNAHGLMKTSQPIGAPVLHSLNRLASLRRDAGKPPLPLEMYGVVLSYPSDGVEEAEHRELARAFADLGLRYADAGELAQARTYYELAMSRAEEGKADASDRFVYGLEMALVDARLRHEDAVEVAGARLGDASVAGLQRFFSRHGSHAASDSLGCLVALSEDEPCPVAKEMQRLPSDHAIGRLVDVLAVPVIAGAARELCHHGSHEVAAEVLRRLARSWPAADSRRGRAQRAAAIEMLHAGKAGQAAVEFAASTRESVPKDFDCLATNNLIAISADRPDEARMVLEIAIPKGLEMARLQPRPRRDRLDCIEGLYQLAAHYWPGDEKRRASLQQARTGLLKQTDSVAIGGR